MSMNFNKHTMKKVLLVAGLFAFTTLINNVSAQTASPQVLATCGSEMTGGGYSHTFTFGQAFYTTKTNAAGDITEGFNQPWSVLACLGDFTGDGTINTSDLLIMMAGYGCTMSCGVDLNDDGIVNITDILLFMGLFGTAC